MAPFSLLMKPVSSECNLKCRYCYYRRASGTLEEGKPKSSRMSDAMLEKAIQAYMATKQDIYSMIWHGGEPTLMPSAFFEKAITFQKKHAVRGSRISNSLQTNGRFVRGDLARLMGRYRFLCGVSLDGPAQVHDIHRRTITGNPTHAKVMRGIATLRAAGVPINILVLVSNANVHQPLKIYRYLREEGFRYIQFVPCVEWDEYGRPTEYALTGAQWGDFLVSVFNEWYDRDIHRVSIRLFESVLAKLVHNIAIDCYNSDACNRYLVVESNGDIFPCDFFAHPAYKLGNIEDSSFEEIITSSFYQRFSARKKRWPLDCQTCACKPLCMGDCPKFRNKTDVTSRLCQGWQKFYRYSGERFQLLATQLSSQGYKWGPPNISKNEGCMKQGD